MDSILEAYSSFGRTSMLLAVSFTLGLHGPRVHWIIPKTLEDLEVMSVI